MNYTLNALFGVQGASPRPRALLEPFALLLAPYAPHLAEELWRWLGHEASLAYEPWPQLEEQYLVVRCTALPCVHLNNALSGGQLNCAFICV